MQSTIIVVRTSTGRIAFTLVPSMLVEIEGTEDELCGPAVSNQYLSEGFVMTDRTDCCCYSPPELCCCYACANIVGPDSLQYK